MSSARLSAWFVLAASLCAVNGNRVRENIGLEVGKEGDDHRKQAEDPPFPCCQDQRCCQNEGNSGFKGLSCAKASYWTGEFPHCESMVEAWGTSNWKPVESHAIKFLRNKAGDPWGRKLEQMQAWSNSDFQSQNNWLEWLFPSDSPSEWSAHAPNLTDVDIKVIKKEQDLQQALLKNLQIFAKFLGIKVEWKDGTMSISDGDDLDDRANNFWDTHPMVFGAIHTCVKSLRLLGLETEADKFKQKTKDIDEEYQFDD